MRLPAYPKYKPSGVEWLGEVPGHWEVKRGRFCMEINPRSQRQRALRPDDEVSFVPMEAVGEYGGLNLGLTRSIADVESGYTEFDDGDVVVAKITPCFENGKGAFATGLLNNSAFGTTELLVLRAFPALDRRFLFYVTISQLFRNTGEGAMYGAGGQKRVPPEFCANFRIQLPSPTEQHAIADFLDRETAKIDILVSKKRTLIERLKEKRTALVSRTVTRGLPPDAARVAGLDTNPKLKPSGIEWIGTVPAHWKLMRLKRTWASCDYGVSETLSGYGPVRVLTMSHIRDGRVSLPDNGCLEAIPEGMLVRQGDLLFNRTNSLLHVAKVGLWKDSTNVPVTFASYLVRLRTTDHATPSFMNYLLNTPLILEFARRLALPSVNQANLNPARYGRIPVAIPSTIEQDAIVNYLDRQTSNVDAMVVKVEAAIERLQEYRTSLINAVTTGKIDVREPTLVSEAIAVIPEIARSID